MYALNKVKGMTDKMKTNYDLYENEKRLNKEGYKYIVGIVKKS